MTKARDIVNTHTQAILAEAEAANVPPDSVARIMLEKVIEIYRQSRPLDDIAAELVGAAENIDPDSDYMFMRP